MALREFFAATRVEEAAETKFRRLIYKSQKESIMQAEVAVLPKPDSPESKAEQVPEDSALLSNQGSTEKKVPKTKPVVIDFSAYCDCV